MDPDPASILKASGGAIYVPSDAYKLSWFGQLVEGSDGDTCPEDLPSDAETLTDWLRQAILQKVVGGEWFDDYPEYVWTRLDDGRTFECRMNRDKFGHYYGYPSDVPRGV